MDQIVANNFREEPDHKYLYCDTCNSLLPAPGFYCVQCEPPKGPDSTPEKGITFFQAILRILLLLLLFLGIAILKLEIDVMEVLPKGKGETQMKVAEDEDFKIFFTVNTGLVNIRSLPKMKTSKIIGAISMGTQVEVLGTENGWSKVKFKSESEGKMKTGWVASKFLDSEIK